MEILFSEIEKIAFKKRLLNKCIELIELRIDATKSSIANAQAAANSEEKSSAGDKYETSRAMSHLEKDMYSRQLLANQNELSALTSIDCSILTNFVATGSFIFCEEHCFFIAAGLGKIYFEGFPVYLLSPYAPVAKLLYNKRQGDSVAFNKMNIIIEAIF